MYRYLAKNFSVYDGDTVRCDIDLGFGVWLSNQTLRLYGINTPEVRGPERESGLLAKKWLSDRVLGKELTIVTHKDKKGKYGRWLATIYDERENLNLELIREGHAVHYG
jgi:micrococcal nuclease